MKRLSKIFLRLGRGGGSGDDSNSHGGSSTGSDFRQLTSKRWRGGAVNGEAGAAAVFKKRVLKTGTGMILADDSPGAGRPCSACEKKDFAKIFNWQPGDSRPWIDLAHTVKAAQRHQDDDLAHAHDPSPEGGHPLERAPGRGRLEVNGIYAVHEGDEGDDGDGRDEGEAGADEKTDDWWRPLEAASEPEPAPCPWCTFFQAMISTEVDGVEGSSARKDGSIRSKFTPYLRIRLAFERLGCTEKHLLSKSILFEVTTRNRSLPWGYIVRAVPPVEDDEERLATPTSPATIRGRKVPPYLDPALPASWLGFCKEQHRVETCTQLTRMSIPGLKLIDCESRRIVLAEEISQNLPDALDDIVEYAALSYVRGSLDDPEDDQRGAAADVDDDDYDEEDDDDGGDDADPLVQLPPLFADAISITQSLGMRYLWIDRYCVPSKRDAAKDPLLASIRSRQIEMMGRIYSQSALALIVAAGQGVEGGIPGISVPREEQLCIKTKSDLFTTTLLRPNLEVASSTWASRAWTYQEGLMSRRRLVFTPWQTYFQCHAMHCHESVLFPLQLSQGLNFGRVFPDPGEMLRLPKLRKHIKTFMAKSLTNDEDRLDAFRGLLYEYSQCEQLGVEHILGLPLFHHNTFSSARIVSQTDKLAIALGWMATPAVPTPQDDCDKQTTIDPYYLLDTPPCPFPSWTWLSWRLQAGRDSYESPDFNFGFHLVGDAMPLIDGVAAAPWMEVSVGFADGTVLSWEIDGDAIARKAERIDFLRLKTFSFGLTVGKASNGRSTLALELAEPAASVLGKAAADTIETWVRRCSVTVLPALADEEAPPERETYQLTGLLLSGRNWKFPEARPASSGTLPSATQATVLICGRRNWEPEGPLVRLGVLGISFESLELTPSGDEGYAAVMRKVDGGAGKKGDLQVQLLELDIY